MGSQRVAPLLAGIAAEYFVAAELSRRGLVASLTLRNTRGIDVLASGTNASKVVGIQVKGSQSKTQWLLNQKAEEFIGRSLFYVFVRLNRSGGHPDFYIVPSRKVARITRRGHAKWLATPGRRGQRHRDTPMRVFKEHQAAPFLERWDILGLRIR